MLKPYDFMLLVSLLVGCRTVAPRADRPESIVEAAESIRWPGELRPMVVLDGPGVIATHAALQDLLKRYAKDYPGACEYSAKAMEAIVSKAEGLYFVRIDHHVDRCGGVGPDFPADLHWWEVYAVTPEGRILARHPYTP